MLSWYMCAGGCCAFLWGIVTVLFLLEFVGGSDGPLTGAELQECLDAEKVDPVGDPCTEAAKRGEGAHPMESIPIMLLNALLWPYRKLNPPVFFGVENALDVRGADAIAEATCRRRRHGWIANAQRLELRIGEECRHQSGLFWRASMVAGALREIAAPAAHAANHSLLMRKIRPPAQAAVAEDPQWIRSDEAAACGTVAHPHACSSVPTRSGGSLCGWECTRHHEQPRPQQGTDEQDSLGADAHGADEPGCYAAEHRHWRCEARGRPLQNSFTLVALLSEAYVPVPSLSLHEDT